MRFLPAKNSHDKSIQFARHNGNIKLNCNVNVNFTLDSRLRTTRIIGLLVVEISAPRFSLTKPHKKLNSRCKNFHIADFIESKIPIFHTQKSRKTVNDKEESICFIPAKRKLGKTGYAISEGFQ